MNEPQLAPQLGKIISQSTESDDPQILPSRLTTVGNMSVRRALPKRQRRTIGAWCFADHFGPVQVHGTSAMEVAPHPHIGLQTVTWVLDGEIVHRDSLGSEQLIKRGELNLMTAGRGVAHSEEPSGSTIDIMHGIQLWIAQPSSSRNGKAAFEHHVSLPEINFDNLTARVLVGTFGEATSSARIDSELMGAQLTLSIGESTFEARSDFEYGIIVLEGTVMLEDKMVIPGHLGYLHPGRNEIRIKALEPSTLILIGGEPLNEEIYIWWNFVARAQDEITEAYNDWKQQTERFGKVDSHLPIIESPLPHWISSSS